mmetsp:Transcript_112280/g.356753  ORF Transcript_112280/g.356753 Transcript_112280/m.356753 type:complete len:245 (+) Transcript_112280:1706-2440(+)
MLRGDEVVHADGPSELDAVTDPGDGVDEALPERRGVQDAVLDGHAENGKHGHEGHNLLDGEAHHRALAGLAGDVEAEDAPVGGHEDSSDRPRRPQKAELCEDVAHREEADGGEPIGEPDEDTDARVDVVAPPLLAEATVELEVLGHRGGRGRRAALVLAQRLHLVVVPLGHPAIADGYSLAALLVHLALLARAHGEGDAEDVMDALFLEGVARDAGHVKHLGCRDGQTHGVGAHLRSARRGPSA